MLEQLKGCLPSIIEDLKSKLKQEKPVEQNIQSLPLQSDIGRISSVGQLLKCRYYIRNSSALADHDYRSTPK